MNFSLRRLRERKFLNKNMCMFILLSNFHSNTTQILFPTGNSKYESKHHSHAKYRMCQNSPIFPKLMKIRNLLLNSLKESRQYDHHCQKKYIISGRFNRRECCPDFKERGKNQTSSIVQSFKNMCLVVFSLKPFIFSIA